MDRDLGIPAVDAVLHALVEPVVVTDAEGIITYANAAAARRLRADKFLRLDVSAHLAVLRACHPDGTPFLADEHPIHLARASRAPVLSVPLLAEEPLGRQRLWLVNSVPLWDGDHLLGTVSTFRESTGVAPADQVLDQAALLNTTLDLVNEAVFVVDTGGIVIFVNAAAARILDLAPGMDAPDRIGQQNITDMDGAQIHPDRLPSRRALAGETVTGAQFTTTAAGGGRRRLIQNAHPLRTPDGTIYAALVTAKDVTEEVEAREELEAARETAESANRLKDDFIAALSHELRAPLQPILGWTEVLRRHGSLDSVTAKALEAIRRNIRQQVRLVDDLLDLSRIVHGKLTLHYETFDLREQVRAATEPYEEAAVLKKVHLTIDQPGEPVIMWGDGARIQQVVTNLVSNAVKYTPTGGHIAVRMVANEHDALIEVEDTGDGIAPDDLTIIFEAFRQGFGAPRRGGLGIGLNLVRRLTELHGGRVDVESEGIGYGARFRVTLPRAPQQTETPPADAPRRRRLDQRSIVIVEDNDDTREVMKYMLEAEGARVVTAATGAEGVGCAKRERPHVVLCDIGLPDIDGLEVARRLRRHAGLAGTRLIALTGYGQPEDIRGALQAGFDAHLTKPINLDQLLDLMSRPAEAWDDEHKDSRWTS